MNLSEPFIRRPVMTTLVMISITFFGIVSYFSLPVSDLPNVDYPTITCTVNYPGANPETMAVTCAVPLEREFMTIDGMSTLFSSSTTGSCVLVLQFNLDKSMNEASTDVQAAINRALPNLPQDLPNNPTYKKLNPSQTPILYMAVSSESMTLSELYDYGNTYIGQRLSMLAGVSQVVTFGAPYAARIQVDPEELAAKGIGINDVAQSIRSGNVDLPTGVLYSPKDEFTIDVDGQLLRAEGYNNLVIRSEDGAFVRVDNVGRALNSLQDDKYGLNFYTKDEKFPCVVIAVQLQPGANTVKVTDSIYDILPTIQSELPSSLNYHTILKKKDTIMESVDDVKMTLLVAFVLVILIIYFSLGKLRDTVIPSFALPLSICGTLGVLYLGGYSIDILSLLAITLSIGFLVDDAIVVLENNVRHVQEGVDPFEAAIQGSKEISMTIISMTLCLMSVFIPMLFLGGIVGKLFREFSVTIIVAVLFSGFISLSLTPLLCSRFIPKSVKDEKKTYAMRIADAINTWMVGGYEKGLHWAMKHKFLILIGGTLSIFGSFGFLYYLPKDFIPNQDEGFIQGFAQSKTGTSPYLQEEYQDKVAKMFVDNPNVESVISVNSIKGTVTDNQGLFFVRLKPYHERKPVGEVIRDLMPKANQVPGLFTYLSPLPMINLTMGTTFKALYQFALTGLDQKTLFEEAPKILKEMRAKSDLFAQVSSDLQITQPQLDVKINRDRASDLQVTAEEIENLFGLAYSDNKISTINGQINQYDVIVETLPKFYRDPSQMPSLYIKNMNGDMVPLSQIVDFEETVGPLNVNHINGLPAVTLSYNLAPGAALGTAVEKLQEISKDLPRSVGGKSQGAADVFITSFANLGPLLLITIFVIYIVLGILYESFIHPITVMSALPPAIIGGLFSLFLFGQTLSLFSFVGLVMLLGIVLKNGIMMIDFANVYIHEGMKASDAIVKAALVRFRPIIMTTMSGIMGAVPIALGIGGSSAQTRKSLGIVIVGGLIISQIITLFLTPVIFYYMEVFQEFAAKYIHLGTEPKEKPPENQQP